jgi:hypothetical protein
MGTLTGIAPWMILLGVSMVALAAVAITALFLTYNLQVRLMRISSERLGIPSVNMELKSQQADYKPKPDTRARIHVPVPGGAMFKPSEPRKTQ